jgi:hypothetical protein
MPAFRRMISEAVRFVERSCRASGVSPEDLPAPSRRAYQYLKAIDPKQIPILTGSKGSRRKTIRISNVVSSCRELQKEFAACARADPPGKRQGELSDEELQDLHAHISALASAIEELLERLDSGPSALADPTLRAYQWLKYLSDANALREHHHTLQQAYAIEPGAHFELYNMAGLFRVRSRNSVRHITANEAFVGAPRRVIQALMRAGCGKARRGNVMRLQEYAHGEEFSEARLDLELIGIHPEENMRGAYYDLGEVFARVNASNFQGRMQRPILTWNKTITHAKFGHYVPATDMVMISIALDSPEVPAYVIEHVMHHELLHRELGVMFVNGRRISHSAKFRAAERGFEGYARAASFLRGMSLDLR